MSPSVAVFITVLTMPFDSHTGPKGKKGIVLVKFHHAASINSTVPECAANRKRLKSTFLVSGARREEDHQVYREHRALLNSQ